MFFKFFEIFSNFYNFSIRFVNVLKLNTKLKNLKISLSFRLNFFHKFFATFSCFLQNFPLRFLKKNYYKFYNFKFFFAILCGILFYLNF